MWGRYDDLCERNAIPRGNEAVGMGVEVEMEPARDRDKRKKDAHIKVLKSNPVIGIGPLQDSLEDDEVVPRDKASFATICNAK